MFPPPPLKFGGETSRGRNVQWGRNIQGRNDQGRNVLGAKRLGEEMDLGRNVPEPFGVSVLKQSMKIIFRGRSFQHLTIGFFRKIVIRER